MGSAELVAGFECSGNRRPLQGLSATAAGPACRCTTVLDAGRREAPRRASSCSSAPITARKKSSSARRSSSVEQQFGRSLPREKALSPEPFLAYALNGEPLTTHQGSPLRLIVPGWYGVANVKWLSRDPRRRKISTSASSRRAGTARCAAR